MLKIMKEISMKNTLSILYSRDKKTIDEKDVKKGTTLIEIRELTDADHKLFHLLPNQKYQLTFYNTTNDTYGTADLNEKEYYHLCNKNPESSIEYFEAKKAELDCVKEYFQNGNNFSDKIRLKEYLKRKETEIANYCCTTKFMNEEKNMNKKFSKTIYSRDLSTITPDDEANSTTLVEIKKLNGTFSSKFPSTEGFDYELAFFIPKTEKLEAYCTTETQFRKLMNDDVFRFTPKMVSKAEELSLEELNIKPSKERKL